MCSLPSWPEVLGRQPLSTHTQELLAVVGISEGAAATTAPTSVSDPNKRVTAHMSSSPAMRHMEMERCA
eukprot:1534456-Prorocentrum_lima.AAC.1